MPPRPNLLPRLQSLVPLTAIRFDEFRVTPNDLDPLAAYLSVNRHVTVLDAGQYPLPVREAEKLAMPVVNRGSKNILQVNLGNFGVPDSVDADIAMPPPKVPPVIEKLYELCNRNKAAARTLARRLEALNNIEEKAPLSFQEIEEFNERKSAVIHVLKHDMKKSDLDIRMLLTIAALDEAKFFGIMRGKDASHAGRVSQSKGLRSGPG